MKAAYIENQQAWKEEFQFSIDIPVRFSETDMYGHLNNTVPFIYFEQARIEFMKQLGLMNDWSDLNGQTIPVVADLQCDFVQQVFFDEKLTVFVKIAYVGNSSIDIHYMAQNERQEVVFTGRGAIVQINKQTGVPHPWTEKEKRLFSQFGR